MTGNEFERITPAQAGLDPRCIINMMDRMEKKRSISQALYYFVMERFCVRHITSRMKKISCELYFRSAKPSLLWQ